MVGMVVFWALVATLMSPLVVGLAANVLRSWRQMKGSGWPI